MHQPVPGHHIVVVQFYRLLSTKYMQRHATIAFYGWAIAANITCVHRAAVFLLETDEA